MDSAKHSHVPEPTDMHDVLVRKDGDDVSWTLIPRNSDWLIRHGGSRLPVFVVVFVIIHVNPNVQGGRWINHWRSLP